VTHHPGHLNQGALAIVRNIARFSIRHTSRIPSPHQPRRGTTMKTLTFGIEIETVGQSRDTVARAIAQAIGGRKDPYSPNVTDAHGRVWRVVTDSSLTGSVNGEVVSPILKYEDLDDLLKIVRGLAAANVGVDQSCAIHLHVGTKHLRPQALANLTKMVFKQERLIEHALGVQERRLARYCRPVDEAFVQRLESMRPTTAEALNRAWYGRLETHPDRYHDSRYYVASAIM
jgi:hypothetical protein